MNINKKNQGQCFQATKIGAGEAYSEGTFETGNNDEN